MRNLSLLTDLYQLTMMNGYYCSGSKNRRAIFDLFFRPKSEINYAIAAGLEQAIEYIKNIKFSPADIKYLQKLNIFDNGFIEYLSNFKFSGNIWAVEEGEVVFPTEPIVIVEAPIIEAQLLETTLLNIINHQTLIASKAARIAYAAGKDSSVIEFGLRRAQGPDAGIYGSRAAMIGGCVGTSNVLSAKMFNLIAKGTHGHSWVLSFDSELEAFTEFSKIYPENCLLLVDSFDTINSGVPNAIKVFKQLKEKGYKPVGIRLDSGDLAYLSKRAREMLDSEGFTDAVIFASNDIDEHLIEQLKLQGAKIDIFGVGTKLITSSDMPSLGGVYKLAQIDNRPVIKFSDTLDKMTLPGKKQLYRVYDEAGYAKADIIALEGETFTKPLTLTHPIERWKKTVLEKFELRKLLKPIFENGKLVYRRPKFEDSIKFSKSEKEKFWPEYQRLTKPHIYKVNLSDGLYNLRASLLEGTQNEILN